MPSKNVTDILVIGGGVTGMSFSIWDMSITELTKSKSSETNTRYVQIQDFLELTG
jgi:aspartate oxidase